jgi:hypothetical protein
MPKTKNQAKNKSRFEVRGGMLNEYEFALNEGAIAEEERSRLDEMEAERELRGGEEEAGAEAPTSPQEREAARIREIMETAHEKARRNIEKRERRAAKEDGGTGRKASKSGKAPAAKKRGGQKKAAKKGSKKSAGKAGKKSVSRKTSTKKGRRSGAR